MDEKPDMQAPERAQGWLKLPNGKALTGFQHDCKRHGSTALFAALEMATGLVKVDADKRRRRMGFLDFMNGIVAEHPHREIHVILDNLNTHKPKPDRWLARHKNVQFHLTPTHASWMSQKWIEGFSDEGRGAFGAGWRNEQAKPGAGRQNLFQISFRFRL